MIIGVPKEIKLNESRVSLVPSGVDELVKMGHNVFVEDNAGLGSGFTNDMYQNAGATILSTAKEVFSQSDMIIKVKEPQEEEFSLIKPNQIIFTYFHHLWVLQ